MFSFTTMSFSFFVLFALAAARTDLTGCTTTDVSSPAGASVAWYVPGTGELCDFLDCGGGTAPPKYSVPGCPQYTGTGTYSPSFLAGYTAAATSAPTTSTEETMTTSPVPTTSGETIASSAILEQSASSLLVPTSSTSASFDTTVTGGATLPVQPTTKPLVCALAASSDTDCGISWSTTTYSDSSTTSVISSAVLTSSASAPITSGAVTGGSSAASTTLTMSFIETRPNGTTVSSATGSTSGSRSASGNATGTSAGAAAAMTGVVGGIGLVVAAIGAVAIL